MQKPHVVDALLLLVAPAEPVGEELRVGGDTLRMAARIAVLRIDGLRECHDGLLVEPLAGGQAILRELRLTANL